MPRGPSGSTLEYCEEVDPALDVCLRARAHGWARYLALLTVGFLIDEMVR